MTKSRKFIITVKFFSYLFVCHSEGKFMQAFRIFFLKVNTFCLTYVNEYISTITECGRKESPRNCGCIGKTCYESDENI